jgi:hypothetical protein
MNQSPAAPEIGAVLQSKPGHFFKILWITSTLDLNLCRGGFDLVQIIGG